MGQLYLKAMLWMMAFLGPIAKAQEGPVRRYQNVILDQDKKRYVQKTPFYNLALENSLSGNSTSTSSTGTKKNGLEDDDDPVSTWRFRGSAITTKSDNENVFKTPQFGQVMAMSTDGNWIASGWCDELAFFKGTGASCTLRVYRYVTDIYSWIQVGQDLADYLPPLRTDTSGDSTLALSIVSQPSTDPFLAGSQVTVAVGVSRVEYAEASQHQMGSGHVRVFNLFWYETGGVGSGVFWSPIGNEIRSNQASSNHCQFGAAVALSEDARRIVVGAPCPVNPQEPNSNNENNGFVEIFEFQSLNDFTYKWMPLEDSLIQGDRPGFGTAVSINANATTIAVAAPASLVLSGFPDNPDLVVKEQSLVLVYDYDETKQALWKIRGGDLVKESNDAGDYMLAWSMALSRDGSTVVVGGRELFDYDPNPDQPSPNFQKFVGHGRVYRYDAKEFSWFQLGTDLDQISPTDPVYCTVVALSGDGSLVSYNGFFTKEGADRRNKQFDFPMFEAASYVATVQLATKFGRSKWKQVGIPLQTSNPRMLGMSLVLSPDGCVLGAGDLNSLHAWTRRKCGAKHGDGVGCSSSSSASENSLGKMGDYSYQKVN